MTIVTVDVALVVLDGETRERPVIFVPEDTTAEKRRELDRWRVAVSRSAGYTAIGHHATTEP